MSNRAVFVNETTKIEKYKYCLVGFPDVGLVGSIALSYIIEEEQMIEVGYLESDALPPVIVVHGGDPKPPLRIYSKGNVVSVISEIPVDSSLISPMTRSIVE